MLCILRHLGIQLILAYSCEKPAILAAGKDGGWCFYIFCFFFFIHFPLSPLPLFHHLYFLSVFSLSLGMVGWCEGVLYLTAPGRPIDIGLQFGKACYPCSR